MKTAHCTTLAALMIAGSLAAAQPGTAVAAEGHQLFLRSAVENADFTETTLPIFEGRSQGKTVWYVVTESSNHVDANHRRVNFAPKLANAKGTAAAQQGRYVNGVLEFAATVDFTPDRVVVPGPGGFPPSAFTPGSVGEAGYSPLVALPDGTVLNASHISDGTLLHDKVLAIDYVARTATLAETEGFYEGDVVYYLSFESSHPMAAALEAATFAPNLNAAPGLGANDGTSARAGIVAFVNGQTGVSNPNRQGLNSALLGEGGPRNIVQEIPQNVNKGVAVYSPMWDMHLAAWRSDQIALGLNVLQGDFETISHLAEQGLITAPDGSPWGPTGFIVNCPVISLNHNHKG
ncbi:MAG: hypothetical protein ABIO65_03650 [Nitrospiria bacterium]